MTNKYRNVSPAMAAAPDIAQRPEPIEHLLTGGIDLSQSAQDIEIHSSPDLDRVRTERGGLRADFAIIALGDPATATPVKKITVLGEHRFVRFVLDVPTTFSKIFRLFPNETTDAARIESWNGSAWVLEVESTDIDINEILISWRSFFNIVLFANSTFGEVFKWDNSDLVQDEGDDFPTANLIGGYGSVLTQLSAVPAGANGDRYRVHYSLRVRGPTEEDGSVTIAVLHNGAEVATKKRTIPASTDLTRLITFEHEEIEFTKDIDSGDSIGLFVKETVQTPIIDVQTPMTVILVDGIHHAVTDYAGGRGSGYDITMLVVNDLFSCWYHLIAMNPPSPDVLVSFQVTYNGVDYFTLASETVNHEVGFPVVFGMLQGVVTGDPMGFRLTLDQVVADWTIGDGSTPFNRTLLTRNENLLIEAHGFNLALDADPTPGVTYNSSGAPVNTLTILQDGAGFPILAKYIGGPIAGRFVFLQYGLDPQAVGWHVNGDVDDSIGDGASAGPVVLPSMSDPVDEIMALWPLGANVGALFRRRSIMRVVGTGRLNPALAFYPWIENLGTDSPHAISIVPGGLQFVGNDKQVYILSETGLQPIGPKIQEQLIRDATNPEVIESVYDTDEGEIYLSTPLA